MGLLAYSDIAMNRSLIDKLSLLLERDERDAVLGDLAEAQASAIATFCAVTGLVVRRQAAHWTGWRSWAALIGITGLAGVSLIDLSVSVGGLYHLYSWVALNYRFIDPALLDETGLTLGPGVARTLYRLLFALMASWSLGLALARWARPTLWAHAVLLLLVALYFLTTLRPSPGLYAVAGLIPAALAFAAGIAQGLRRRTLDTRTAMLAAFATLSLTVISIWADRWWRASPSQVWFVAVLNWPVVYILAGRILRQRGGHA